jgi:hypothetical protein
MSYWYEPYDFVSNHSGYSISLALPFLHKRMQQSGRGNEMTFVFCNNCHWLQDDFWDPRSYDPILQVEKDLLLDELLDDEPLEMDKEDAEDRGIEYIKLEPWDAGAEEAVLVKRKDFVAAGSRPFCCSKNPEPGLS